MSITKKQWTFIMDKMLGLRSGINKDDIDSAASYAMNCGQDLKIPIPPVPGNWDALLHGTITYMQGFENYKGRFLLIVSKSTKTSDPEYPGCFPKCSSKPTKVWNYTSLNSSVAELTQWVVKNIPEE